MARSPLPFPLPALAHSGEDRTPRGTFSYESCLKPSPRKNRENGPGGQQGVGEWNVLLSVTCSGPQESPLIQAGEENPGSPGLLASDCRHGGAKEGSREKL